MYAVVLYTLYSLNVGPKLGHEHRIAKMQSVLVSDVPGLVSYEKRVNHQAMKRLRVLAQCTILPSDIQLFDELDFPLGQIATGLEDIRVAGEGKPHFAVVDKEPGEASPRTLPTDTDGWGEAGFRVAGKREFVPDDGWDETDMGPKPDESPREHDVMGSLQKSWWLPGVGPIGDSQVNTGPAAVAPIEKEDPMAICDDATKSMVELSTEMGPKPAHPPIESKILGECLPDTKTITGLAAVLAIPGPVASEAADTANHTENAELTAGPAPTSESPEAPDTAEKDATLRKDIRSGDCGGGGSGGGGGGRGRGRGRRATNTASGTPAAAQDTPDQKPHDYAGRADVARQGKDPNGDKRRRRSRDESAATEGVAGGLVIGKGKKHGAGDTTAVTASPTRKTSKIQKRPAASDAPAVEAGVGTPTTEQLQEKKRRKRSSETQAESLKARKGGLDGKTASKASSLLHFCSEESRSNVGAHIPSGKVGAYGPIPC